MSAADPSDFVSWMHSHVPQILRKFPLRISTMPNSLAEVFDRGMCQGYAKRAQESEDGANNQFLGFISLWQPYTCKQCCP